MPDEDVEIKVDEESSTTTSGGTADGADGTTTTTTGAGDVADGVAELQRKLDEAERGKAHAERERDAAFQRAGAAESQAHGSQLAIVLGALETIEANKTTLEAQYEEALTAGDFKRATTINSQIVEQAAQKVELQRGKAALEAEARRPAPRVLDDSGKVDLYVQNMKPRAAAWIRAHPDYVTDDAKNTKLLARHWAAKEAGHEEGTDGYFHFIETGLGLGSGTSTTTTTTTTTGNGADTSDTALSTAAQPTQRRDAQPSPAPPSRGGGGSRTVRLTPAQQEAARMSGLTNQEYAENMVREQKAGNIGPKRVH